MKPVRLAVVGAGARGSTYAGYAGSHPERAQIVAVAEPRPFYRQRLAHDHGIAVECVFADWRQLAQGPRLADAVILATQDALHVEPAVALAQRGYHLLLEKPMAPDASGCHQIYRAVKEAGVILAVCHVLRYTAYTQKLKALIEAGTIGDIVNIQRLEPVGYWHQAHSFVRGNWRREDQSSSMLLAKSCHDIDWLRYIMGASCQQVSSFGSRRHFRAAERPEGAADNCLDCAVESQCPYSAKKIYLADRLQQGHSGWPVDVLSEEATQAGLEKALREGPYGRCVYACDNDVVDNQVVNLLFAGGRTASFTMTAFSEAAGRQTRIFGTRGELRGDDSSITHFDFLSDRTQVIDTRAPDASILGGHGGGDFGLMHNFVEAVSRNDPGLVLSGPEETLESHLMVFAAEQARRAGTVEEVGRVSAS
ncbi:MAG: gfo/Idh/MocA family oxidoreductase [Candidatus Latescibacteria bacterium]|nr:gfo/Idh/MocA family oxidoreductase [Candidatus Latescibacterota bacterium]